MSDASNPKFQGLRRVMETVWLPAMLGKLDMQWTSLPAIWDADFLYGPPLESGLGTYMLCEINASSVFPYPVNAASAMARAAVRALMSAKAAAQAGVTICEAGIDSFGRTTTRRLTRR